MMDPRICRHCLKPTAVTYSGVVPWNGHIYRDYACEPCREKVRQAVEPMLRGAWLRRLAG